MNTVDVLERAIKRCRGDDEEWRDVRGLEGRYQVSSLGRVRSIPRARTRGGILKAVQRNKSDKYLVVGLPGGTRTIHRLVAEAFLERLPQHELVRHLNGVPTDNRVSNLAWGTHSENNQDTVRHGRNVARNRTHCPRGHEYNEANTHWYQGVRRCRACWRARRVERADGPIGVPNGEKTHCPQGHPYAPENTYTRVLPSGTSGRQCIECGRARARTPEAKARRVEQAKRWRARKREASAVAGEGESVR